MERRGRLQPRSPGQSGNSTVEGRQFGLQSISRNKNPISDFSHAGWLNGPWLDIGRIGQLVRLSGRRVPGRRESTLKKRLLRIPADRF